MTSIPSSSRSSTGKKQGAEKALKSEKEERRQEALPDFFRRHKKRAGREEHGILEAGREREESAGGSRGPEKNKEKAQMGEKT